MKGNDQLEMDKQKGERTGLFKKFVTPFLSSSSVTSDQESVSRFVRYEAARNLSSFFFWADYR